jgi:dTDP-D-glucose 4,6-dehydratase
MKYLITGITGFLGPHLANKLIKEGHEVYGLVRINNGRENDIRDIVNDTDFNKITFLYGEITDFRMMNKIFSTDIFDGVFHLAAQSHPPTSFLDPIMYWKIIFLHIIRDLILLKKHNYLLPQVENINKYSIYMNFDIYLKSKLNLNLNLNDLLDLLSKDFYGCCNKIKRIINTTT